MNNERMTSTNTYPIPFHSTRSKYISQINLILDIGYWILNEYLGMMIWQANSVTLVSTMNND
jgi:hypothetical protein